MLNVWYVVGRVLVGLILFSTSTTALAESSKSAAELEASLQSLGRHVEREGFLEGATFTLWRLGDERLEVEAERVEFQNKRVGWFYTPLTRSLALTYSFTCTKWSSHCVSPRW